ncbi:chalcone isomerase family protein [Psychrosphaera sp. 1_MG-2023]|uniref:chalcone isomerase family protein n=1 Tax=Psychrosphaera sp. 1_MG-2023 TaxID=3062643 RepID=UPI0026E46C2D|nr:chalcone isomerase family protein [Psychrosphaera sp. 1_MG-2023]MDO6720443.1 chalcone isomerase family protein [Psychrosphaera sp. 1_MG-2023]
MPHLYNSKRLHMVTKYPHKTAARWLYITLLTFVSGALATQSNGSPIAQLTLGQNTVSTNANSANIESNRTNNTVDARPLKLVGKGRFKFAFWSIYDAALYTQNGKYIDGDNDNYRENLPLYLKLTYLRDIEKQDLVDNTFDQWRKQKLNPEDMAKFRDVLLDIWPNVSASDSLAIEVNSKGSLFYFNDQPIGPQLTTEFGTFFTGIWLAKNSTEPTLRQQLIGSQNNETN